MKPSPCALVIGAAGQDGSYLMELLLEQGYRVVGVVRSDPSEALPNLERVCDRIELVRADLANTDGFFNASSSWVFGRPSEVPQTERTPYAPVEPYGAAKAFGDFLIRGYRERHDLYACSGLFYNHESPRRHARFVTRKITKAAASITLGLSDRLVLGDVDAQRDWGFAADYVRAAWLMLQADEPADYVIATGQAHTVRRFAEVAFATVGRDLEPHLVIDATLGRAKGQVANLIGDASAAREKLGWAPTLTFDELVKVMVDADMAALAG